MTRPKKLVELLEFPLTYMLSIIAALLAFFLVFLLSIALGLNQI
jgi:hypothetical protein